MILDNLGMGELLLIFIAVVFVLDPKKLGKLVREFGRWRRKLREFQGQVRGQLDQLAATVDNAEKQIEVLSDKAGMRKWAREQAVALPAAARAEAAEAVAKALCEWPSYRNAKVVSCFAGTLEELDTSPLLNRILADGKTLLMPYVVGEAGVNGGRHLAMAPIASPENDLQEGAFHILEPRQELRGGDPPAPDLVVVPGLCFDARGGRLGKGLGFYDKYLAGLQALKVGACFDVQITQKNLALEPHDQLMDAIVSEKRFLVLSAPRPDGAGPS
jgi:5-formyltetrahydrofolate cyclo-ligase